MKNVELEKFVEKLLQKGLVYSPVKVVDKVLVKKISSPKEIDWSGELPLNTFKSIVLPAREDLFDYKNKQYKQIKPSEVPVYVLGINVLDLQALSLLEQVFEKDIFFQDKRRNTYYVGFTNGIEDDFRKYKVFHQKYEEDVLEHLLFDVFIEKQKNGNFLFFSGSEKGQLLLEKNKITDYENIEFAGLTPEQGVNKRILENRKAIELNKDHPLWAELAEICLACGKCTMNCPTCFCFNETEQAGLNGSVKSRHWTSCFYPEFSKVAGGNKNLEFLKDRIYFWYYHKFVRIPEEFNYYGCVSCMRCFKTCPVAINIAKNLQRLKK